jgi:CRP-like cAMP-binding protein
VQGAGTCLRIETARFDQLLAECPGLQAMMKRFLYVHMSQLATASSCTRNHDIAARLARWLLVCRDRIDCDEFPMTHEFLGYMLGVRRVGITQAAGELQRRGVLVYRRGQVRLLDRAGLEEAACPCYASDREVYQRFLSRRALKESRSRSRAGVTSS